MGQSLELISLHYIKHNFYSKWFRRVVAVVHGSISPNIVNHPIDLLAQSKAAFLLDHVDELFLEEHGDLLVIEYPPKEPNFELLDEALLVG